MQPPSLHGVFADTSFFYAFLDKDDRNHSMAVQQSESVETRKLAIVSTWEIVMETVTLLRYRHSYGTSITFIREVLPSLQLFSLSENDRQKTLKLFEQLSRDKNLSLCDITSYFIITKHLKHMLYLAFDDDFRSLGLIPFAI